MLLCALIGFLLGPEIPPLRVPRVAGFDLMQFVLPRVRASQPTIIVDIDEASLATQGQWPWPRTMMARLITTIAAGGPAAIGVDLLMSEPDRLSPTRLPALVGGMDADLAERLQRLPSNDAVLADALRALPVVVGMSGLDNVEPTSAMSGLRAAPVRAFGGDPRPYIRRFTAALKNVDEIDRAAPGHGLFDVNLEGGVARGVPLVAAVGPTIVPTLGLEMLRLVSGEPTITVQTTRRGIRAIGVGDLLVPTQPDGSVWIHYSRSDAARVPAADVLAGTVSPLVFDRKLVLIGVTARALSDYQPTPVADRMPGVEIHAQLLEGMLEDDLLSRPRWTLWLEAALAAAGGLVLIWAVPVLPVWLSAGILLLALGVPLALALALYLKLRILLDAVWPVVTVSAIFTTMLGVSLAEAKGQRRILRRQLARQREAAARLAGELEAARRIQMGSLPKPTVVFPGEKRFDLYAFLAPAREVGGDLYDFFAIDSDRICLLIGDVSGKGLPGCLFMTMSKSSFKSVALGRPGDVGAIMRETARQISRDNAEGLFVTLWAGILDVATGQLEYCNAGHDPPYIVVRRGQGIERLAAGGGPPLCVLEDWEYAAESHRLNPRETLYLVTDGIIEATSADGELYGRKRLETLLAGLEPDADVSELGEAIRRDVMHFAEGVEAADDLAILVLRWNGP